jgi:hypothetical protein
MTNPTTDLCDRLRKCYGNCDAELNEAADLIEAQAARIAILERERDEAFAAEDKIQELHDKLAARIQQQALEYITLFDQCSEALEIVKALEAQLAEAKQGEAVAELVKSRDMKGTEWFDIKIFDRTLEHGTKLFRHPPAAAASEPVWCEECGDGITAHDPGICGCCYHVKYKGQTAAAASNAHELWAAAQLAPGEAIEDGVARIDAMLTDAAASEDKRDAERYRYLRSKAIYEGSSDWVIEIWGRFASFEEALDAQIAAKKEPT